jgi:hypothetical protein
MTITVLDPGAPLDDALATAGVPLDDLRAPVRARWTASGGVQLRTLVSLPGAAGLLVRRPGTASPTLRGVWLDDPAAPSAEAALDALLAEVEAAAWAVGGVLVRAVVDPHEAVPGSHVPEVLAEVLTRRGWGRLPDPAVASPYPHDAGAVPTGWVLGRDQVPVPTAVSMRQTTDYTCGPVATSLGLTALGLAPAPTRSSELAMWREATLGGACDPYGLALAAVTRCAATTVVMDTREAILAEHLTADHARDTNAFLQREYAERAVAAGATVEIRSLDVAELLDVVAAGRVALVLIDQSPMHADADPHWVLAYGRIGDVLLVDDPWTDEHLGETWVDGAALAVPLPLMDALAGYGSPRYRAVVVLGRP